VRGFDPVFHAIASAFQKDRFTVVRQSPEDRDGWFAQELASGKCDWLSERSQALVISVPADLVQGTIVKAWLVEFGTAAKGQSDKGTGMPAPEN